MTREAEIAQHLAIAASQASYRAGRADEQRAIRTWLRAQGHVHLAAELALGDHLTEKPSDIETALRLATAVGANDR